MTAEPRQTDPSDPSGSHDVTVVVCTRNRAEDLPMAVESILANDGQFSFIVIDQSTDGLSANYLATVHDDRLSVITTSTTGLSTARNIGLSEASTDLVLMTDDDCVVSTTWVADMVAAIVEDDRVAAAFGAVDAAPCDHTIGFIPDGPIDADRVFRRVSTYDPRHGIGACVGFRKSAVNAIGGFDVMLGAGAPLSSAEEIDVVLRLLLAGNHVRHATQPLVIHHGFRTFEQTRPLVRGYMLGTAAAHMKLVRLGHPSVLAPFGRALWGSLVPPTVSALRRFRIPPILGRLTSTARGMSRGLRLPVDRERGVFAVVPVA